MDAMVVGEANGFVKLVLYESLPPSSLVFTLSRPNRETFTTEIGEFQRLKEGDIVTCNYETITTRSTPCNPKISRLRKDITWRDVVQSFYSQEAPHITLGGNLIPQLL